jgi:hypothetical protein
MESLPLLGAIRGSGGRANHVSVRDSGNPITLSYIE